MSGEFEPESSVIECVLFTPPTHVEVFQKLIGKKIGVAPDSFTVIEGISMWKASDRAYPTIGSMDDIEVFPEMQMKFLVLSGQLRKLIDTVTSIHPYETFCLEQYSGKESIDYHSSLFDPDMQVKVILTTTRQIQQEAYDRLHIAGCGRIGTYEYCFFTEDKGGQVRIETIAPIGAVREVHLAEEEEIFVRQMIDSPVYAGRSSTAIITDQDVIDAMFALCRFYSDNSP